jgi:hypothetical protein
MPYLALVLIALGGWFKAASAYQLHGYAWADQTCLRMRFFCNNSNLVLLDCNSRSRHRGHNRIF